MEFYRHLEKSTFLLSVMSRWAHSL